MKRMAIIRLTPEALRALLKLPDGMTLVESRIRFDRPGVMELKVSGAGWETPEGAPVCYAEAATIEYKEDGSFDIDWKVPH